MSGSSSCITGRIGGSVAPNSPEFRGMSQACLSSLGPAPHLYYSGSRVTVSTVGPVSGQKTQD